MQNVPPVWVNIIGSSMDAAADKLCEDVVPANEGEVDAEQDEQDFDRLLAMLADDNVDPSLLQESII